LLQRAYLAVPAEKADLQPPRVRWSSSVGRAAAAVHHRGRWVLLRRLRDGSAI